MANCKARFYDARRAAGFGKKLDLVEDLVLERSDPLTHIEIQFSNRHLEVSFSSTLEDGADGCRFKDIDYLQHSERWTTITLPLTDEEEDRAFAEAKRRLGRKYDLFGALIRDPNKDACTEAVEACIFAAKPNWISLADRSREDLFYPENLFQELLWLLGMFRD